MTVYGGQTVTLVKRAPSTNPADMDDLGTMTMTETLVNMPGCLHRPMEVQMALRGGMIRAEEEPAVGVSAAVQSWKTSVPVGSYGAALRAAVLGIQSSDQLLYNGERFQVIGGPEPHPDFTNPFVKITITSERQVPGN